MYLLRFLLIISFVLATSVTSFAVTMLNSITGNMTGSVELISEPIVLKNTAFYNTNSTVDFSLDVKGKLFSGTAKCNEKQLMGGDGTISKSLVLNDLELLHNENKLMLLGPVLTYIETTDLKGSPLTGTVNIPAIADFFPTKTVSPEKFQMKFTQREVVSGDLIYDTGKSKIANDWNPNMQLIGYTEYNDQKMIVARIVNTSPVKSKKMKLNGFCLLDKNTFNLVYMQLVVQVDSKKEHFDLRVVVRPEGSERNY